MVWLVMVRKWLDWHFISADRLLSGLGESEETV